MHALKQRHGTAEMARNDTKMGSKCERYREKRKYNSILTATWPPPQYAKWPVLNFGRGIYLPPLRVPHYNEILLFVRVSSWDFFCTPVKLLESPHFRLTVHTVAWCFSQCQFFNSKWNCNLFLMPVFYFVFSQEKVKQDESTKEDREAIE